MYCEVPAYFIWKNNKFSRRQRGMGVPGQPGVKQDHVLSRVYIVHPNNTECCYMRLLLHEVQGPTCFNYLKIVSGVVHPSYKFTCQALRLLEDNANWDQILDAASISDSPQTIR